MPRTRRAPFLGARQATVAESPPALTAAQLHALLDILTHSETYREVERFKDPTACAQYGYPFSNNDGDAPAPVDAPSACPIQQLLLKKLVLTLPPVRALPAQFWSLRMQGLLTGFAEAGLSESYEKGAMGTRKTLATGASAIIEIASRGCLGGCPGAPIKDFKSRAYDRRDAGNLARAWNDAVRQLVYGDLIRELFDFAAQNENLEEHSPAVRASAEWIILQYVSILRRPSVLPLRSHGGQASRLSASSLRRLAGWPVHHQVDRERAQVNPLFACSADTTRRQRRDHDQRLNEAAPREDECRRHYQLHRPDKECR